MESVRRRYIKTLLKFRYAFRGFKYTFLSQKSLRYEVVVAITTLLFSIVFLEKIKIPFVVLCIGNVLSTEILNTAIERLCDFVYPHHHKTIGLVKDVASSAVFVSCVGSVIVAVILVA
jgi:diacylglycerol kinase